MKMTMASRARIPWSCSRTRYWLKAFGGAPDVVGRPVLVNNFPMTVVGVTSAAFRGIDIGDVPAVWIPAAMKKQATPEWDKLLDRRTRWMQVIGRLRPGVTGEQAQAGLQPWFKSMLDEDTRREGFPLVTAQQRAEFLASTLVVTPAAHGHSLLRQDLGRPLQVLMAATLLLLLLASLNVASLFLARGAARGREIRTRLALGASRGRIASLLLADSVWIAGGGGALGLLVAPMRVARAPVVPAGGRDGPVVAGGRTRVRVRAAHDRGHRRAVRGRARVAGRPRAADVLASESRGSGGRGRAVAEGAGRGTDGFHAGAARGRGAVRADASSPGRAGTRLRDVREGGLPDQSAARRGLR